MLYRTDSPEATTEFGRALGGRLQPGDVILLAGDLGAGKSVLARGLARGLGITQAMPSPTFTLMIPYEARGRKLYHFDLYRLSDPDEYYAAGLDEFVGGDGVAVVEWPQMADLEAEPALCVRLERGDGEQIRRIEIENRGVAGYDPALLAEWRADDGE